MKTRFPIGLTSVDTATQPVLYFRLYNFTIGLVVIILKSSYLDN